MNFVETIKSSFKYIDMNSMTRSFQPSPQLFRQCTSWTAETFLTFSSVLLIKGQWEHGWASVDISTLLKPLNHPKMWLTLSLKASLSIITVSDAVLPKRNNFTHYSLMLVMSNSKKSQSHIQRLQKTYHKNDTMLTAQCHMIEYFTRLQTHNILWQISELACVPAVDSESENFWVRPCTIKLKKCIYKTYSFINFWISVVTS